MKTFGEEHYNNVAYFNFEEEPELCSIFQHNLKAERIIEDLGIHRRIRIDVDTLIILDEIQFCNAALTSLKYFCENAPEYHIACAGSLLGVMMSKPLSFPVGKVDIMSMYPMCFPEFLIAVGEEELYRRLLDDDDVSEIFRNKLDRIFREYCFVGGMPEAVSVWNRTRDPGNVRRVQRNIMMSYEADFAKHAPSKDIQKLNGIWASIPEQLSRGNRRFIFGHAVEGARGRDLEDALQWLVDAGLVYKVNVISRPSIPLSAYADRTKFKLYCSDVGILGAMARIPASSVLSSDERFREFKGGMAENYVLTELIAGTGEIPFYWRSEGKAEVDFVHMIKEEIVPIEVKSGNVSKAKSLTVYIEQYGPEKAFIVSPLKTRPGRVTYLPLSLVWNIENHI